MSTSPAALALLLVAAGCGDGLHAPLCADANIQTFNARTLSRPAPFVIHHPDTWSVQTSTNAATLTRANASAAVLVGPVTDRGSNADAQAYLDSVAAGYPKASIDRFSLRGRQAMRIESEVPQPVPQGVSSTAMELYHTYYFIDGTTVDVVSGSADASSNPEVVCEMDAIALSIEW
jgi:hypothetical protein